MRPAAFLLAWPFLLLSAACGGDSSKPDTASASIGPSGGTVTTPLGASVTVPPGAVAAATTFTIAKSPSTLPAGIGKAVGPVYRFGPAGMTFGQAVAMTLPFTESQIPAGFDKTLDLVVFTAPDGQSSYTSLGRAQVSGSSASAQTTHFSECVVGVVNCAPPCSMMTGRGCVCPTIDGGTGGTGACTVAASCTPQGGTFCIEFPMASSEIQSSCTGDGGSYATSPCSRTGSVGGCRIGSSPGCSTSWYYASGSLNEEQARTICTQQNGTFVSP